MKQIRAHFIILALIIGILAGYVLPGVVAAQTCEEWVGKVVSVQGEVYARRAGETQWLPVKMNDMFCPGDMIRTQGRSRAAIVLRNEAILRLDQKTTISFSGLEKEQTSILDLATGAVHFFSRFPRGLKVITPFVNAAVEGTEFFIRVEGDRTLLSIFEGQVAATNKLARLILSRGESAVAQAGQAPVPLVVVNPRDAVKWALYYPPVLEYRPADFGSDTGWQAKVRRSIEFYWNGDLTSAFSSIEGLPEDIQDPRFYTYRAGLLLTVGCVDEAGVDIKRALNLDPSNSQAFALQSIIAVVQNQRDQALDLASKAVELAPESPAARVALSYALQAGFDLQGALSSLREAVELGPENALAWSRLSELWLSFGDLDRALEAAKKAVVLNPNIARTQTVLGFSYLTQIKIRDAKNAFERAIELDQTAPLPRLGLGLAKIRDGNLKAGREEIEIAASLDPDNSLIRSYLGKAYYDEKRDRLAKNQFAMAKELDPKDPTAWFYDAIRKQSVNRPVEALEDLQKSIELNDNRAVYRSRLMLDEDLAARSASLARIYNDLGFQQLALVEGWNSVNTDPANYSAHRFLADSYAALPRHEIARVSELLQSQLLQPINITPVQPQLAESNLFILEGAGPADPSFNEFNPLFERNRLALQASGVAGGKDTLGDEITQSGLWGRYSYSIGQFHYETDGFRENNDQNQDIYNAFGQVALSYKTSVQAEYQYKDVERGDLPLRFDPDEFLPTLRKPERLRSARLGFHHAFAPRSHLIGFLRYGEIESAFKLPSIIDVSSDDEGYDGEIQHLLRSGRFNITSGAGYYDGNCKWKFTSTGYQDVSESDIRHTNAYVYAQINYPKNLTWTLGGSADFFKGVYSNSDQFNPKAGLTWNIFPGTTLRAAGFRTLRRTLLSSQTIEPTQVAGFNQFFNDFEGTDAWRYGVGIDHRISTTVNAGAEVSRRDMEVPFEDYTAGGRTKEVDWKEDLARIYLYWTPQRWLVFSAEYQFERFKRDMDYTGEDNLHKIKTHRFPLAVSLFSSLGFSSQIKATYIDQEGEFGNRSSGVTSGDDRFWIVDAFIRYRLPKRWGFITLEACNLFDEDFQFQDTDPAHPVIYPERLILTRLTLAF
jgi:tetratricopeptide (TPR) repeat protein